MAFAASAILPELRLKTILFFGKSSTKARLCYQQWQQPRSNEKISSLFRPTSWTVWKCKRGGKEEKETRNKGGGGQPRTRGINENKLKETKKEETHSCVQPQFRRPTLSCRGPSGLKEHLSFGIGVPDRDAPCPIVFSLTFVSSLPCLSSHVRTLSPFRGSAGDHQPSCSDLCSWVGRHRQRGPKTPEREGNKG